MSCRGRSTLGGMTLGVPYFVTVEYGEFLKNQATTTKFGTRVLLLPPVRMTPRTKLHLTYELRGEPFKESASASFRAAPLCIWRLPCVARHNYARRTFTPVLLKPCRVRLTHRRVAHKRRRTSYLSLGITPTKATLHVVPAKNARVLSPTTISSLPKGQDPSRHVTNILVLVKNGSRRKVIFGWSVHNWWYRERNSYAVASANVHLSLGLGLRK